MNLVWNIFKFDDERFDNIEAPLYDSSLFDVEKIENLEEFVQSNTLPKFSEVKVPEKNELDDDTFSHTGKFCSKKNYNNDLTKFKISIKELSTNQKA